MFINALAQCSILSLQPNHQNLTWLRPVSHLAYRYKLLLTLYKRVWITHLVAVLVPRMVRAIYRLQSSGGIAGDVWHGGSGRAAIAETVYILDNLRGSRMAANPPHGRLSSDKTRRVSSSRVMIAQSSGSAQPADLCPMNSTLPVNTLYGPGPGKRGANQESS